MPFTIYVNVPEDDERAIMIEKSVDAEFRAATTVEDVMCDKCRQKVTKTRTKKIRDEPNAFIVNIRRAKVFWK
jgi:ubiquitin C-terminal hydrolase